MSATAVFLLKTTPDGGSWGFGFSSGFGSSCACDQFLVEENEGFALVANLAAVIRCDDGKAGRCMCVADGGFGFVAVLATRATCPEGLERDLAGKLIQVD